MPQERTDKTRRFLTRRLLGVLFAALALGLALPPSPAFAHAELVSTDPAAGAVLATAPSTATFTFDEPVSLVPDGFQLYDGSGAHRPLIASTTDATVHAQLPPGLPRGSYVVGWRVVSDDSHPESGVLSFAVGRADATAPLVSADGQWPVSVLYGTLTALGYVGLFVLVGLTVFDLLVARTPATGRRLPRTGAVIAVISYTLLVPVTVVRERGSGLGSLLDHEVLGAGWSSAAGLTLALAAVGAALMLLHTRLNGRGPSWAGLAGAAVALASVLPVGHTRTYGPTWLIMGSDLVHAATAAVWLGGLVGLAIHLTRARRQKGDPVEAGVVVGRFSTLAGGLVVLLGATGTVQGVIILGSVSGLVGTTYGQLLLVKVGLVAVIGGLALWNRYFLIPRLGRAGGAPGGWARLSRAVRLEAFGLVLVLGLTSALTMQNPRSTVARTPTTTPGTSVPVTGGTPLRADLGTGHLIGTFSPGTVGINVITFDLNDAAGGPIVPLAVPQVSVAEPNLSLGPFTATVQPGATPGSYRSTVDLPQAGQWKITVAVRVNELEQPAAVADVVVVG